MDWIVKVLASEFVWGIIIGLLLAVVVAIITLWLNTLQRRRIVAAFCQDLVGSICDLIQNLEDNRTRNRVIDHEFLETITAEITVYGRNREHLVVLKDAQLRKDIRDFFTRVAALLAQIRWRLAQFYEVNRFIESETDPTKRGQIEQIANSHLSEAHKACDRLRELCSKRENLDGRLKTFAKRLL